MSEHAQTFADALDSARIVGLWHQTQPREVGGGIDIMLFNPRHLIHLKVVGDKAITVAVAHDVGRDGGKRYSETITGYASHHELAEKIEAIYQATLDRS